MSEVQSLAWMYLRADRLVEVVVADLAILINVELVIDFFELLICHFQAPVVEVKSELVLCDFPSRMSILVHV